MKIVILALLMLVLAFTALPHVIRNFAANSPFWESAYIVLSSNSVAWGVIAVQLVTLGLILRENGKP